MAVIKEYLGDGVYIDHNSIERQYILTVENGSASASETIYIDDDVMRRLQGYVTKVKEGN